MLGGLGPARRLGGALGLALIVAGSLSGQDAAERRPRVAPIRERPVAPAVADRSPASFPYVGSLTCNGRGCHGGIEPAGTKGSEYTNWMRTDRHAIAFAVLSDPRSVAIVANLRRVDRQAARPEADTLCLSCHALPQESAALPLAAGGVGCESCHGPAGNWLHQHYGEAWKSKGPEKKAEDGLADLSNAVDQARTCMPCHVGDLGKDTGKEVHHDLIAAGHPRLRFEFSAFMAQMPRHWDDARPTDPAPRRWLVGQVAAAESAVRLLADRASRDQAWPELAEFDCFACHHDLRNERFRLDTGRHPDGLGQPCWRTWDLALLLPLARKRGEATAGPLERLADAMLPGLAADPGEAKSAAPAAQQALRSWLGDLRHDPDQSPIALRTLLTGLTDEDGARLATNWDSATQLFRAAAALADAEPSPTIRGPLGRLLDTLSYPEDRDSPALPYPSEAVPEAIADLLKALRSTPRTAP